ncbi:MAG: hypothetical protein VB036_00275 [Propionicimonas sp.]|nr:hypothetical protein [Propionicimonas sp.]
MFFTVACTHSGEPSSLPSAPETPAASSPASTPSAPAVTTTPVWTPPPPAPELSSIAPDFSDADLDQLIGGATYAEAFRSNGHSGAGSILGTVAAAQFVDGMNHYGQIVLPIFPLYDNSGELFADQLAHLTVDNDRVLMTFEGSIELGQYDDPSRAQLTYLADEHAVQILSARTYYASDASIYTVDPGTELYTQYQKMIIPDVPAKAWKHLVSTARDALKQADAYLAWRADPDKLDEYGNKPDRVEYPTFSPSAEVSSLLGSRKFTTATVVTSPLGEGKVGSLAAKYSGGDYGSYSEVSALSPKAADLLVAETAAATGADRPELTPSDFPDSSSGVVRALNLAVFTGMKR